MYHLYNATLQRIVDGDTMDFCVDLGFDVHINIRVRLADVNTPETYGVARGSDEYLRGMMAKNYAEEWFRVYAPDGCTIKTSKTGKYGRWIATIFGGDHCLNDDLRAQGW